MTETERTDAIDWNDFWTNADEQRRRSAHVSQYGNPDLLTRFIEDTGIPDSFASVGCGPAACPIELAVRYPEMDVFGYDPAASALEEARKRAQEAGADNTTFASASIPGLDVDRRFDLVYCYATLHYVRDVDTALTELYDRTRPGGHLVFNYPNRRTAVHNRRLVSGELDWPLPADPDAFRERFHLVFEEDNLLSTERIESILGVRPRDFWSTVDAPDEPWTGRHNPCVYVPK